MLGIVLVDSGDRHARNTRSVLVGGRPQDIGSMARGSEGWHLELGYGGVEKGSFAAGHGDGKYLTSWLVRMDSTLEGGNFRCSGRSFRIEPRDEALTPCCALWLPSMDRRWV